MEVDDFQEYESEQEQVLSLRAELESDLYVFSAHCGPSDKDKVRWMYLLIVYQSSFYLILEPQ